MSGSDVDQRTVREINKRIVHAADRFVFYHQKAPWVLTLLAKGALSLNRIRWGNAKFAEPPSFAYDAAADALFGTLAPPPALSA